MNMAVFNATLDTALAVLSSPIGAAINPAVPAGAAALAKLRRVLQAGVAAHEQATGEPLDMAKLHQIAPLPVPDDEAIAEGAAAAGAGEAEGLGEE